VLAVAAVGRVPLVWRTADGIFVVIGLLLIASESRRSCCAARRAAGAGEPVRAPSPAPSCCTTTGPSSSRCTRWARCWTTSAAGCAGGRPASTSASTRCRWPGPPGCSTPGLGARRDATSPRPVPWRCCAAPCSSCSTPSCPGIAIALPGGRQGVLRRCGRTCRPVVDQRDRRRHGARSSWPSPTTASGWWACSSFPVVAVHRGAISALERDHMTLHDPLTGLPNQLAFRERLVEQLERPGTPTGTCRAGAAPGPHRRRRRTRSGPSAPTT
jgi:hypothetical protein